MHEDPIGVLMKESGLLDRLVQAPTLSYYYMIPQSQHALLQEASQYMNVVFKAMGIFVHFQGIPREFLMKSFRIPVESLRHA